MTKTEILEELAKLRPAELAEVQARLDELMAEVLLDKGALSETEKTALDSELAEYEKDPDAGSSPEQVNDRIQAKLGQ